MSRHSVIARRAESLLDAAVVATAPVAGGDICTATKLRLSDGSTALFKTLSPAPAGFFEREAAGLRWLGEASGGVDVPEVLAVAADCLILRWIEPGRAGDDDAAAFGRALAATHASGAPGFGGFDGSGADGFIGTLPLPQRPTPTWAEFFAVRRVLPYAKLARDRGALEPAESAAIDQLIGRLTILLPEEPPARLHGDLWNGNVVWDATGTAWVIDPAAYGGHREMDLAMLSLFGLPHLPRVIEGYQDVAPLADGWEDRLALHQLFPLLAHACLFGGGSGARAAAAAQRYL
ncbi:fructosamine kinase family protein [Nocardioides sp. R-C-SC26]|uniref:fructosamine kinase family protein n=1 Tax=Nocardioides sp. R-C-SC26 TaxID=2870414 RepID=UPI001E5F8E89|nr:fructosamine kinase family protein [Nocardioides sp. R-C-SC26]